jgi:hypothetical protein
MTSRVTLIAAPEITASMVTSRKLEFNVTDLSVLEVFRDQP